MPRRHIKSAAGALAATLLLAATLPAGPGCGGSRWGDTDLSGPVPFADIQDCTETEGTLRSTYEFNSNWAGFVETSVNERDYREPLTVQGFRRGSTGWTALTGVNLRLWGTLFGEIGAGWGEQQPIDDNFARSPDRWSTAI